MPKTKTEFTAAACAAAARRADHRLPGPIKATSVDRRVWAAAYASANGDLRRLRIDSPTSVLVANRRVI